MCWDRPAACATLEPDGLAAAGESLRRGVWPRSLVVWMAAGYAALFILRPWEMVPFLAEMRFERLYAAAMIAAALTAGRLQLRLDLQTFAAAVFLACLEASVLGAWRPDLSSDPFYVYATLIAFYLVLASVIRTPYELTFLAAAYIGAMAVYLAKSEWEFFVNGRHRFNQGVVRLVGIDSTFGGPNALALSVVLSLPVLLFLFRVRGEFCREWPTLHRRLFVLGLAGYLALALSAVVLTNSRSGAMTLLAFLGLAAIQGGALRKKLLHLAAAGLLLGGAWLALPEETRGRYETIWRPEAGPKNAQTSAEGRVEGFWAGLEMFARFPITGVGMGNFVEYRKGFLDGVPLQAHNLAGQLLGETGLVGAAGFLLLVYALWRNCRRIARGTADDDRPAAIVLGRFAQAATTVVALLLVEGLFAHNLYRFNWLWLAAFGTAAARLSAQIEERDDA